MSEPEVFTPLQLRMGWRLGQGGANCYPHTPRVVEAVVEVPLRPVALVPECPVSAGDGAPATVGQLARRVAGGAATYSAALYPDGPTTIKGVSPEGAEMRVPAPAFDRWVLIEWITVRWRSGFALWRRSGRGRWTPAACWWRHADDGGWRYGKAADVPSSS